MPRQTVSLCMITKNSQATIGIAIKSALALVDTVIIVDLNSSDDTRLVAEGYGAKVIQCTFNDDYSKIKNLALKHVVCDWVLWLNPDEIFSPLRPVDFQNLLKANAVGYTISITSENTTSSISSMQEMRLFRNHSKVRYQYPAKERIEYSLRKWQATTNFDDIEFTDTLKIICDTEDNNIIRSSQAIVSILEKYLMDNPNDPYLEYAIACEYITEFEDQIIYDSKLGIIIDKLEKAKQKAFALNNDKRKELDYLADLLLKLSACYLAAGKSRLAWHTIKGAKEFYPENHAILLQCLANGISYLHDVIKDNKSAEAKKWNKELMTLIDLLRQLNVNQAHLVRYVGDLALFMGDIGRAQACFKLTLNINANNSYALLGLAQCQVYLGNKAGAMKFYMAATEKNKYNYLAWLQGSRLLKEIGFTDNANSWRNKIFDEFPYLLESETNN